MFLIGAKPRAKLDMADRAARLKALRAKAGRAPAPAPNPTATELKFRNYAVEDEKLDKGIDGDENEADNEDTETSNKKQKLNEEEVEPKSAIDQALEAAKQAQLQQRGSVEEIAGEWA